MLHPHVNGPYMTFRANMRVWHSFKKKKVFYTRVQCVKCNLSTIIYRQAMFDYKIKEHLDLKTQTHYSLFQLEWNSSNTIQ